MNWTAFKKFGEFSIYMELEFTYYKYAKQSKILRDRIKLTCLFLDKPFQIQHILCTYMNSNFKKDLILWYAFAFSLKIGNTPNLILFFSSKLRKFKKWFLQFKNVCPMTFSSTVHWLVWSQGHNIFKTFNNLMEHVLWILTYKAL